MNYTVAVSVNTMAPRANADGATSTLNIQILNKHFMWLFLNRFFQVITGTSVSKNEIRITTLTLYSFRSYPSAASFDSVSVGPVPIHHVHRQTAHCWNCAAAFPALSISRLAICTTLVCSISHQWGRIHFQHRCSEQIKTAFPALHR